MALLTPAWAERFRGAGRVGTFVAELVEFFKLYHARTYGWDGAPIHDAVAVAQVIKPELVETRFRNVEVELENPDAPSDYDETLLAGGLRLDDLVFPALDNTYPSGTRFSSVQGISGFSFGHQKLFVRSFDDLVFE